VSLNIFKRKPIPEPTINGEPFDIIDGMGIPRSQQAAYLASRNQEPEPEPEPDMTEIEYGIDIINFIDGSCKKVIYHMRSGGTGYTEYFDQNEDKFYSFSDTNWKETFHSKEKGLDGSIKYCVIDMKESDKRKKYSPATSRLKDTE